MNPYETRADSETESAAAVTSPLREIWRRRGVVAAALVATVLVALALTALQSRTYRASADVKVSSGNLQSVFGPQANSDGTTLLATQVAVLESTQMRADVGERVGDDVEIVDVLVEGVPESQVATVTVDARTAEGAAKAANAYVLAYVERRDRAAGTEAQRRADALQVQVEELTEQLAEVQDEVDKESTRINLEQARITIARDQAAASGIPLDPAEVASPNTAAYTALQARYQDLASRLGDMRTQTQQYQVAAELSDGGAAVVSTATPPARAASPNPTQTAVLAGLLGLALGIGLALLLAARDRRLHDRAAVSRAVPGVPVLGSVAGAPGRVSALELGTASAGPATVSEDYLALASQVLSAARRRTLSRLLVTSAGAEDGKAGVAAGLAVGLAALGQRVALVEADLRAGGMAVRKDGRPGLCEVINGTARLQDTLLPVRVHGSGSLRVLPAGRGGVEPTQALTSEPAARALQDVASQVDFLVVVGAPLLPVADSMVLLPYIDSALLSVQTGVTTGNEVTEALDRMAGIDGGVLGLVLTGGSPARRPSAPAAASRNDAKAAPPAVPVAPLARD